MKSVISVLTFDLGASSGRAIVCDYQNGTMKLREVHRFENTPIMVDGYLRWDFAYLCEQIKQGLVKAYLAGGYESVGIDTWGVDYGLLDQNDQLLEFPVNYRDPHTHGVLSRFDNKVDMHALYVNTGIQVMEINTVFPLAVLLEDRPALRKKARHALMMPDLFNWYLTGIKASETTIASTTQLFDPTKNRWNDALFDLFGIPRGLFPDTVKPGTSLGNIRKDLCDELGIPPVPIIAVASHDTASAVAAIADVGDNGLYLSCGTWSLLGTTLEKPLLCDEAYHGGISNELGYRCVNFHKNIVGLWLLQESRRQFEKEGRKYSFGDMEDMAASEKEFKCFIDTDNPAFSVPGDIPKAIREYCANTGQETPDTDGAIIRCIYESLAFKYRATVVEIARCTQKRFNVLHLLGGGAKSALLSQMSSDAMNLKVEAGPVEASAVGNAVVQLITMGAFDDLPTVSRVISDSFGVMNYQPKHSEKWNHAFSKYTKLLREG